MFIGNRIRFIRKLRGLTQEELGLILGFPKKTAEIRISQYETGRRKPKDYLINAFSVALDVSPHIFTVPDIDDEMGLLCTLFALEDHYGLQIDSSGDGLYLYFNNRDNSNQNFKDMLSAWLIQAKKLESGEIDKATYDLWRYNFPNTITYEPSRSEDKEYT